MTTKTKLTTTTAAATSAPAAPLAKPPSKSALVLKLLGRAKGATIAEIEEPTGWQPHSTRAYLSGLRKKGRTVIREQRKSGETAYRLVDAASLAAAATPAANAPPASSDSTEASGNIGDITSASEGSEAAATADTAASTLARA